MTLIFITEARFLLGKDNNVYSLESSFSSSLYKRYLEYFDKIIVIGRAKKPDKEQINYENIVTDYKIQFIALPYYVGFNQFIKNYFLIRKKLFAELDKLIPNPEFKFICRIPGRIGSIAISYFIKNNIKYALEVVGDPFDVLSNGSTKHPLRILIRYFAVKSLKFNVKKSSATLYVTKNKLQERYPSQNFNMGISDVMLNVEAFKTENKYFNTQNSLRIICVGSLEQMYKGPDIVIKCIQILKRKGIKIKLYWIGDGIFRKEVENLIDKFNLKNEFILLGKINSPVLIREELDKSDLFVMASRTEGLPRAMLEAMARRLPCVGSDIGGITELIDKEYRFTVNNYEKLAEIIYNLNKDINTLNEQSNVNYLKSLEYRNDSLNEKRRIFFNFIKYKM